MHVLQIDTRRISMAGRAHHVVMDTGSKGRLGHLPSPVFGDKVVSNQERGNHQAAGNIRSVMKESDVMMMFSCTTREESEGHCYYYRL